MEVLAGSEVVVPKVATRSITLSRVFFRAFPKFGNFPSGFWNFILAASLRASSISIKVFFFSSMMRLQSSFCAAVSILAGVASVAIKTSNTSVWKASAPADAWDHAEGWSASWRLRNHAV